MNLVFSHDIGPREGWSGVIRKGQRVKITDVEGGTISDIVTFNLENLNERFDQGRTKANQGRIKISTGNILYSKYNTAFMTIVEDTTGGCHDLDYGMCNSWVFSSGKYKGWAGMEKYAGLEPPTRGCWEILTECLEDWSIQPEDIPSPFNAFQDDFYNLEEGLMGMQQPRNKAGDYVVLQAEIDLLYAMTSCPCASRPNRVEILQEAAGTYDEWHKAVARNDDPANTLPPMPAPPRAFRPDGPKRLAA
ncbi:MAG: urea carboxylase-associated family protein [Boseongicola sp.]|nr:urea carboxylase-associated family protein [Boseongicola sp.]MYH57039.1 urea carboxylase-associated family protein [Boseongicola sp. SB0675_bin_26]